MIKILKINSKYSNKNYKHSKIPISSMTQPLRTPLEKIISKYYKTDSMIELTAHLANS